MSIGMGAFSVDQPHPSRERGQRVAQDPCERQAEPEVLCAEDLSAATSTRVIGSACGTPPQDVMLPAVLEPLLSATVTHGGHHVHEAWLAVPGERVEVLDRETATQMGVGILSTKAQAQAAKGQKAHIPDEDLWAL